MNETLGLTVVIILVIFAILIIALNIALFVWVFKTKGQDGSVFLLVILLLTFTLVGIAYGLTRNFGKKPVIPPDQ